jgi:hypothetical protein
MSRRSEALLVDVERHMRSGRLLIARVPVLALGLLGAAAPACLPSQEKSDVAPRREPPALPAAATKEGAGAGREKARPVEVLVLEERAKGLPNEAPEKAIDQKMLIDPSGRRLVLIVYRDAPAAPGVEPAGPGSHPPAAGRQVERRILLRMDLDPPQVYELWDQSREFRRSGQDLNRIQEERDKYESSMLRRRHAMTAAERKSILEDNFLREDGKRIVTVERGGTTQLLGHSCEEVRVLENGRTVIRALVTRDIPNASGFFHLYRRLGAFSKEVLDKVADLEGLPLWAEITVVTAVPAYKISAQCLSVKREKLPLTEFDVPPTYREVKTDLPPIVKCPNCGKDVERDAPGAVLIVGGIKHFFDTEACKRKYRDDYVLSKKGGSGEDLESPGTQGGGAAKPKTAIPAGEKKAGQ